MEVGLYFLVHGWMNLDLIVSCLVLVDVLLLFKFDVVSLMSFQQRVLINKPYGLKKYICL